MQQVETAEQGGGQQHAAHQWLGERGIRPAPRRRHVRRRQGTGGAQQPRQPVHEVPGPVQMIVDRIYRLPGDDVVEQVDRRAPIVDGLDDGAAGDGVDSQQAHRQDRAGGDEDEVGSAGHALKIGHGGSS